MKIEKKYLFFSLFLITAFILLLSAVWILISRDYILLWNSLDQLLNGFLSRSTFHTTERDKIIFEVIIKNLFFNSIFLFLSLLIFAIFKKNIKFYFLAFILIIDLFYNTRSLLFFGSNNLYISSEAKVTMNLPEDYKRDYRFLIRNYNAPYTEFGTYWEAMAVRAPFSDSFIDINELQSLSILKRMADGNTPDWNMTRNVRSLNGYTTLLPNDVNQTWNEKNIVAINNLPEINITNPLLANWSTKYYLVDNWFEVKEDLSHLKLLSEAENWSLYELPNTLPRFRFDNGTSPTFTKFSENPNNIEMEFENDGEPALHLIIADRYDKNWRAWVNGKEVQIENYQGMRRVPIFSAKHNIIKMTYQPVLFYLGAIISALSIFSTLIIYLLNKKKKNW